MEGNNSISSRLRSLPEGLRYALALVAVGLSLAGRLYLREFTGLSPYLLFMPAVLLCAWLLGRAPAALAAITSGLSGALFFVQPFGSIFAAERGELVLLTLYLAVCVLTIEVIERLNHVNHRLRDQIAATERIRAQAAALSEQRALLLKEINHRIKNHLHAVAGLAGVAKRSSRSLEEALAALGAFEGRLQVLARVYDRLDVDTSSASLDAKAFIEGMGSDLRAMLVGSRSLAVTASADAARLTANEAAYLGLIINEAVSNSLKYAFPDERPGTISITFEVEGCHGILRIADDGVGRSGEVKGTGTGTRLIEGLVRQLGGEVVWSAPPGTQLRCRLPLRAIN